MTNHDEEDELTIEVVAVPPDYVYRPPDPDGRMREEEYLKEVLNTIRAGECDIGIAGKSTLVDNIDRVEPILYRTLDDPSASPLLKVDLADALFRAEVPGGREALFEAIRHADRDVRYGAAIALGFPPQDDSWDPKTPASEHESRAIVALLADPSPDVRWLAVGLCSTWRLTGLQEHLTPMLMDPSNRRRGDIAHQLARAGCEVTSVPLIAGLLRNISNVADVQGSITALCHLVANGSSDVSSAALSALEDYFARSRDQYRYASDRVKAFAEVAPASALPTLECIFEEAKDAESRGYALEGMARIDPDRYLPLAIASLNEEGFYWHCLHCCQSLINPGNRDLIIDTLCEYQRQDARGVHINWLASEFLLAHGGNRGREAVVASLGRHPPDDRLRIAWRLNGWTAAEALGDLMGRRWIAEQSVDGLLDRAREEWLSERVYDADQIDESELFLTALAHAHALLAFDAEADQCPPRHDELTARMARLTNGLFMPQSIKQIAPERDDGDHDTPYTIEIVWRQRLYRFGVRWIGGWYDTEFVHRALNYALESAGLRERFLRLGLRDLSNYVFGDPSLIRAVCEDYCIALEPSVSDV